MKPYSMASKITLYIINVYGDQKSPTVHHLTDRPDPSPTDHPTVNHPHNLPLSIVPPELEGPKSPQQGKLIILLMSFLEPTERTHGDTGLQPLS